MTWDRKVPVQVGIDGLWDRKVLDYDYSWHNLECEYVIAEDLDFTGTLIFVEFERGRSAVITWVYSPETRTLYPMSWAAFSDKFLEFEKGCVAGSWIVRKHGTNYRLGVNLNA